MKRKKLLVLSTILIIAQTVLILGMFYPAMSAGQGKSRKKQVPSWGSVKSTNVGVYSDQTCTTRVESIHWGLLEPGVTANQTVYMRNEGNSIAILAMTLSNWNPSSSSNYINLNWDYTGQPMNISQVIQVRFTLFISENIQGITDFSFDVTITTG